MQSTREKREKLHVAIIMDGNGRWATRRGLPRSAGHHAGIQTVRRVSEAAPDLGIAALTLFAFSSDNWRRPAQEVSTDPLTGVVRRHHVDPSAVNKSKFNAKTPRTRRRKVKKEGV